MITKQNVIDADPVLIVYPAGTGGEHIAHTLSMCCDEFEELETKFVEDLNQHHTICVLNYSTAITNIDDFNTALDARYTRNFDNKRIVLKDHPTELTLEFYSKHLPDITTIFVTPIKEVDYFADLTFKKLAVKVDCPITEDYIRYEISDTLTNEEYAHLIAQANQYDWVWRHELHILTHQIREQGKLLPIEHFDTLDKIKNDHKQTLINTYITTVSEYKNKLQNCYTVNCDSLKYDSTEFWQQVKEIIPTLDLDRAIKITNTWVEKNNKLGTN
jgi:hypothetical protein